jgi:two-component system, NtrC family, response regulator HydG
MSAKRILLLEDDESLAELLVLILRSGGYAVDLALTVAQAERQFADEGYELVVADWRLPDGDGIEFADRAAERGMKTAVLTGYAFQMPPEKAERHEVWLKPMRPRELIAAVERCIGKSWQWIG